jgi:serine/threonine-protein kinase
MSHPATINKYQVIKHLGSGAFGDVYRVVDHALQTEKAIKILGVTDPNEFVRCLEEAQVLNKCRHKHIVTINEANIFDVDGTPRVILDLEYIAEGSLEDALTSRWVSTRESIQFLRNALQGLEHAHGQGILHRDIKPGNILLGSNGAKLSDFGLATQSAISMIGSLQGYKTHAPPECFKERKTSIQSDVFAAGVTLFRTLSNISNWKSVVDAIPDVQSKIESGKLIDHIGFEKFLPPQLIAIVKKACAPSPTKRFRTAQEFRQKLDALRFGIDWVALNEWHWEGRAEADTFSIEVDKIRNALIYKKNGRRMNAKCGTYTSLSQAVSAMLQEISTTTLQ